MRYNHLDMLPSRAFTKIGKKLATLEGGGGKGDTPDQIPVMPARVSSGFGSAIADPMKGKYSYTLDPRLAAMRDMFYGGAQQFAPTQQELQFGRDVAGFGRDVFTQGGQQLQQAIGMSPQDASTSYYNRIQELQAPTRAMEESRLADTLFKTGRLGAATAYGGGGGYINPEQFGLLTARSQADKALGLEAEQYGRNMRNLDLAAALGIQTAGLGNVEAGYGLGMLPYQSAGSIFGMGTDIEKLGLLPMQIGLQGAQNQLALQQQQQQYENATAQGGKGGGLLGGVVKAGANYLMSGGNPIASAAGFFSGMSGGGAAPTATSYLPGFGGYGSQVINSGSQYSSLLGGNAALPNYSIGPRF